MQLIHHASKPIFATCGVDSAVSADERMIHDKPWHRRPQTWLPVLMVVCAMGLVALSAQQQPLSERGELALLQRMSADDDGAQLQLALAYREGRLGLQADAGKADYWMRRAAANGNAYAQHELGAVERPDPVAQFIEEFGRVLADSSIDHVKSLAAEGDNRAQFELALRYRDGSWGVARNEAQSRLWMQRAAAGGNELARRLMDRLNAANG